MDSLLIALVGVYTSVAPYSKVEESFNLQAIHDVIFYGSDVSKYDHVEFPGVVPRSFIGAVVLGLLTKPIQLFLTLDSKFDLQLMARGLLAVINTFSLIRIRHILANEFNNGKALSNWFTLFQFIQFHVVYYSSRTLPNMIAFPLVIYAFGDCLTGNYISALSLLSFVTIVFRIELVILIGSLGLALLVFKKISLVDGLLSSIRGLGMGTLLSLIVDSYFWQHFPIIPEVHGFIFNVLEKKSALWGVEPWYSYFIDHIPKMVTNPMLLGFSFMGLIRDYSKTNNQSLRILSLASLLFVTILSLQPHKEWRFIVYTMPVLSMLAASGAVYAHDNKKKALVFRLVAPILVLSSIAGFGISVSKLALSSLNYPGGVALSQFNSIVESSTEPLTVHMDVPVCMTGATRFGQVHEFVYYDKTEDVVALNEIWTSFDYLITVVNDTAALLTEPGYEWNEVRSIKGFKSINSKVINTIMQEAIRFYQSDYSEMVEMLQEYKISSTQELRDLANNLVILEDQVFIYKKVKINATTEKGYGSKWENYYNFVTSQK